MGKKDSNKNVHNLTAKQSFNTAVTSSVKILKNDWMHLCIDVQKDACDPKFFQEMVAHGLKVQDPFTNHLPILDTTAKDIANFTEKLRSRLSNIWVYSDYSELRNREDIGQFFNNQGQPHHVSRRVGEPTLKKSQKSAVPENIAFFRKLKEEGVRGFIVTGFFADDCILETVKDLRKMGFDITVVEDLIQVALPQRKSEGIEKIKETGAKLRPQQSILNNLNTTALTQKSTGQKLPCSLK